MIIGPAYVVESLGIGVIEQKLESTREALLNAQIPAFIVVRSDVRVFEINRAEIRVLILQVRQGLNGTGWAGDRARFRNLARRGRRNLQVSIEVLVGRGCTGSWGIDWGNRYPEDRCCCYRSTSLPPASCAAVAAGFQSSNRIRAACANLY